MRKKRRARGEPDSGLPARRPAAPPQLSPVASIPIAGEPVAKREAAFHSGDEHRAAFDEVSTIQPNTDASKIDVPAEQRHDSMPVTIESPTLIASQDAPVPMVSEIADPKDAGERSPPTSSETSVPASPDEFTHASASEVAPISEIDEASHALFEEDQHAIEPSLTDDLAEPQWDTSTMVVVDDQGSLALHEDIAATDDQNSTQSAEPGAPAPRDLNDSFFDCAALTAPIARVDEPVEPALDEPPRAPVVRQPSAPVQPIESLPPPSHVDDLAAHSPQAMLLMDGPPAAAFAGCPNCRKPMVTGAIVCLSCGYNVLSGEINPEAIVRTITHLPARSSWRGPLLVGSLLTAVTLAAAALLFGTRSGFIAFAVTFLIAVPAWFVWALVDARDTEGAQLKIWLVPGYIFAWVYGESRSRYLRAVTVGVIAIILAFAALGYEWKRTEREQQRAHLSQSAAPST